WGAEQYGDGEAVVYGSERLSFRQLAQRVHAFARGLIEAGVRPGEKVALWMSDRPEWLVARWAVPIIGAVLVPVNTRFRSADVQFILAQSDTTTLILQDAARSTSYFGILEQLVPGSGEQDTQNWKSEKFPELRRVIGLTSANPGALPSSTLRFEDIEATGAALLAAHDGKPDAVLRERAQQVEGDTVAQILYTSGTTSFPKGAMVCHGPLLQNKYFAAQCLELTRRDRYLSCV